MKHTVESLMLLIDDHSDDGSTTRQDIEAALREALAERSEDERRGRLERERAERASAEILRSEG